MSKVDDDIFLNTSHASRVLGCAEATTRARADRGEIPCVRTSRGARLFRLEDVMRLANERSARRGGREQQATVDPRPREGKRENEPESPRP